MNFRTLCGRLIMIAVSALFIVATIMAQFENVEAFRRNTTVTGPGGRSGAKSTVVNRTANGYNRSSTMTGPNGYSASRNSQGCWDPATKTWVNNTTTTGPGGNGYSSTRTTTISK